MADDEPKPPKPYVPPEPDEATRLYWDRLDAKFANAKASPPAPLEQPSAEAAVPTAPAPVPSAPVSYEPVSYETPSAAPASAVSAPSASAPSAPASGLIAEAFAALLALEDGQPGAKPVRLTTSADQPPPPEPKITDAVIEDVVRRVIERLGPDAVRAVVVDVVSQISERLVKEEIDRIRKQHV
jgi:hypothetical protein